MRYTAAARACSVIHPATWQSARDSMLVLCWKCVGLILLLAAAALAVFRPKPVECDACSRGGHRADRAGGRLDRRPDLRGDTRRSAV